MEQKQRRKHELHTLWDTTQDKRRCNNTVHPPGGCLHADRYASLRGLFDAFEAGGILLWFDLKNGNNQYWMRTAGRTARTARYSTAGDANIKKDYDSVTVWTSAASLTLMQSMASTLDWKHRSDRTAPSTVKAPSTANTRRCCRGR